VSTLTVMPFGKHRGKPLAEVPKSYLKWMLANATDLRPDTREAFEAAVTGGGQLAIREPGDDTEKAPKKPARARSSQAFAKVEHVVACHRCGGSSAGRTMIHLECLDKDDVPF
jgi:Putative quorum-sensing-regulated virulence factor